MSAKDVMKMIEDQDVKFIDFRFTDTIGKEQHVSVPAHTIDIEKLEDGQMFDGSSISGWKDINDSDMMLVPDAETAILDPFTEEVTLNIRCNIVEVLVILLTLVMSQNFLSLIVSNGMQDLVWVRLFMKSVLKRLPGVPVQI